MSRGARRARENFKMFHAKDPREELVVKNAFDSDTQVVPVGKAREIYYRSDKWEKDDEFNDYVHLFTSKPAIYLLEGLEEPTGRPKKLCALLGARPGRQSPLPIAQLGYCLDLSYESGDTVEKLGMVGEPLLLMSGDRKTLLVLTDYGPVAIRGGSMYVGSRGIVN